MSVRDGLLAILTIGPAYGHQLHSELRSRAAHRGPVNVGQIYSTIDRLSRDGMIVSAGSTSDSLPLHRLTDAGYAGAARWMTVPVGPPALDWTEMLDQLVVTSTIDRSSAEMLAGAYRRSWTTEATAVGRALDTDATDSDAAVPTATVSTATASARRIALLARQAQAGAASIWLSAFVAHLTESDTVLPYADSRPKRGRRPRTAPAATP